MGWSCRADAAETLQKWSNACITQTGSQNVYRVGNQSFFWEVSSKEHDDGAITGKIWRHVSETHVVPAGSFRINGDGTVARAPAFLKNAKGAEYVPLQR